MLDRKFMNLTAFRAHYMKWTGQDRIAKQDRKTSPDQALQKQKKTNKQTH